MPVDGKNVVVTSMDGFKANDMIQFKDLGPQVSWKGVRRDKGKGVVGGW